jgi:tetratricopeptide (TPR) repeat protein
MRIHKSILVVIVACLTVGSSVFAAAPAPDAEELFEYGLSVLAKGDFDGAIEAFAAAAKADPQELNYRQHHSLLRRVVQVRAMLDQQANTERWVEMTKSLRAFYYDYKVFGEALALDERVHDKLNTAESATALGETQLELKMNEEAAAFLGALDKERTSPRSQVLLGVALARLDRMDEAEKIAAKCKPPKEPDPAYFLDMACLCALLGEKDEAAKNLTLCFEHTPPSLLDAAKDRARAREDLNGLATSAEYEKVWLTASKIKESTCSGGASCGSCPSAATCTSGDKGGK